LAGANHEEDDDQTEPTGEKLSHSEGV